jgi:hypothetical protein
MQGFKGLVDIGQWVVVSDHPEIDRSIVDDDPLLVCSFLSSQIDLRDCG